MTPDQYRAKLKKKGLTRVGPSYNGASIYSDREGMMHTFPDPEELSPEERESLLEWRLKNI